MPNNIDMWYAVEYVAEGPQTVAGLMRGETRVHGLVVVGPGGQPEVIVDRAVDRLASLQAHWRVYSNSLFARAVERRHSLPLATRFHDLKVARWLLDEQSGAGGDSLGTPPTSHFGGPALCGSDGDPFGKAVQTALRTRSAFVDQPVVAALADQHLEMAYYNIELPIIDVTIDMIFNGMPTDGHLLDEIATSHFAAGNLAECQLQNCAGRRIDCNSYPQMSSYLFDELWLPVHTFTDKGNASVEELALSRLAALHPAVNMIRTVRHHRSIAVAARQLRTFYCAETQRIHPELDPAGAVTGRFSCRCPNLQATSAAVRDAIRAPAGHMLLEADFSQVELRVLAELSQEPRFLEAFQRPNGDIHRSTAAAVLGISEEAVTQEQRDRFGKTVNFGIIYGRTGIGLAESLGITVRAAQSMIDAYFCAYPSIKRWIEAVQHQVGTCGWVATCFGRRRRLPNVFSADSGLRAHAMRQAVNAVIQGTAAEINKLALIRLRQVLPGDCRLLLTVHDSVVLSVPDTSVDYVAAQLHAVMETVPQGFGVPLPVRVSTGKTWADCKGH